MNVLLGTVLVPLLFAVISPLAARIGSQYPRWVALLAVVTQGAGLVLARGAHGPSGAGTLAVFGDALSVTFVSLVVVTGLLAVSASWKLQDAPGAFFALILIIQSATALVFLTSNVVMFYVAWELVIVPMFLLIARWGSAGGRRAAMKYLAFSFAGGAALLVGILITVARYQTASLPALIVAGGLSLPVFWLFAFGFLVKLPVVPVHTWLPDAHTEAPAAGSIILAGTLLKMGGYGLIRVGAGLGPEAFVRSAPVLAALGIIGIVWGAATALVQTDLKRLVAYSSVAHMGFVLLAVAIHTPASLSAAVLTMFSHGLVAGLLFFLVGAVYERTHTRELSLLGGLGAQAKRWSIAFVFASLASAGLPALSGFPGEFMTLVESWRTYGLWTIVAAFGVVLAAAYNLRAVAKTVQGPTAGTPAFDLDARESITAALVAVLVVGLGLAPWILTTPLTGMLTMVSNLMGGMAR